MRIKRAIFEGYILKDVPETYGKGLFQTIGGERLTNQTRTSPPVRVCIELFTQAAIRFY